MSAPEFLDSRDEPHGQSMLAAETPLLLHSLKELEPLISSLLAEVAPERVVEIGGESGRASKMYLRAGVREVVCVDPSPGEELRELAAAERRLTLVLKRSPGCIPALPSAQFWILDGDHNYATVRAELEAILAREDGGRSSMILVHDVLWPCGRRDLYYDPEALGGTVAHPHCWSRGPTVGREELTEEGFVGAGRFAVARSAGGEGNGVRTALEDVLAARPGLGCALIPIIFGLAVVYPLDAPWAPAVASLLRPLDRSRFLTRLELNRIALYSRVLELQHQLARRDGSEHPPLE